MLPPGVRSLSEVSIEASTKVRLHFVQQRPLRLGRVTSGFTVSRANASINFALFSPQTGVVRNFFQQFGPVVEVRKTSPFDSRICLPTPTPAIRTSETVPVAYRLQVLVMRDPHNHQSRGFGFITFQRDESAKQVLQNRYHDMLGKRVRCFTPDFLTWPLRFPLRLKQVEVKSAVPRGQAPPPQRGPPRSSQGYGYGQPRGGPAQGGGGNSYGYGGSYASPQNYTGTNNPWGMNSGFNDPSNTSVGQSPRGDQTKASYGFGKDLANSHHEQAGNAPPAHGWTEHTAPEGYVYYYNSKSGVSQWERPMELDFPLSN